MKSGIKNLLSYVVVIIVALLIKEYVFSPIKVNGTSMYPTLKDGDIMILNEIGYYLNGLNRFDIVVVNNGGEKIIKRVIGLPGEVVEYKYNKLYINGEEIKEDFEHEDTKDFSLQDINIDKIPEDYYFLVGDNRNNSKDSRVIGLIHKSQIRGKTSFIVYPFDKIGSVK